MLVDGSQDKGEVNAYLKMVYLAAILRKPKTETMANSDVEGNLKGFIFPFIATTPLKIDKQLFNMLKKITSAISSGFSAI